jgi:DNA processing protein
MSLSLSADDTHLLALCAIPQLGAVTRRRLLRAFDGSAEDILKADTKALCEVEGISDGRAKAIKEFGPLTTFEKKVSKIQGTGVSIAVSGGPGYPEPLNALGEEAPLVLYIKGSWQPEDVNALAIVGSRNATDYGKRMATRISSDLGKRGVTVVSGMALGIDTESHRGSMQGGGRTIAVVGSGIDIVFPAQNKGLMGRIGDNGAVISEFGPGAPGLRMNFPIRNKTISALSLGVLVVEAATKSGSLITARHALKQQKPVFAVPGNADSPYSEGANELIRNGARVITDAEHIIHELAHLLNGPLKSADTKSHLENLPEEEKNLCEHLSREPIQIDALVKKTGTAVHQLLGVLLSLELKGIVKQAEGKRFYLI